jgi:hypothetical protein
MIPDPLDVLEQAAVRGFTVPPSNLELALAALAGAAAALALAALLPIAWGALRELRARARELL